MGLLEVLLGKQNPAAQWANKNTNFLGALGAGLASGPDLASGIGQGLRLAPQARMLDMQAAQAQAEQAKAEQQQNQTRALFEAEAPDLARLLDTGIPMNEVWGEYLRRKQPQGASALQQNASDRQALAAQYGLQGDDMTRFVLTGELPTDKAPSLPASYQEYQLAQSDPNYARTLASSSTKPPTEGERRNNQLATVIGPELASVEQNWSALTDAGNQIKGADVGGNRPGLALTTPEYQQAINSLSTIVASYLYSVSGATATDAEFKRQVDLLTPKLGDSEKSTKDKLDRIKTYARAVTDAAGRAGAATGGGGTDDIDALLTGLGI